MFVFVHTQGKTSILKQNFRRFRNFFLTAQQAKGQKSYSQMWLKRQLYIELGWEHLKFYLVHCHMAMPWKFCTSTNLSLHGPRKSQSP